MFQKDCNQNIFFCADLIEVIELDDPMRFSTTISKHFVENYSNLKCPKCTEDACENCSADMFDSVQFLRSLKLARALQIKQRVKKAIESNPLATARQVATAQHTASFVFSTNTQASGYMFYTQNDAEYFKTQSANQHLISIGDRSQYAKLNSILDALEHTGYYGFVTFVGCVQCDNVNDSTGSSATTQKSQTNLAATQFRTQSFTQGLRHK